MDDCGCECIFIKEDQVDNNGHQQEEMVLLPLIDQKENVHCQNLRYLYQSSDQFQTSNYPVCGLHFY
jgi:hypothetical protein